jgi:hypothetical protein
MLLLVNGLECRAGWVAVLDANAVSWECFGLCDCQQMFEPWDKEKQSRVEEAQTGKFRTT